VNRRLPLLLALLGVLPSAATADGPTQWILATIAPEGSPVMQVLDEFARSSEHAANAAGARIKLRTRHGGVGSDELDGLRLCMQGRVQAWVGSTGAVAVEIPAVSVLDLPFLFHDLKEFERARAPKDDPLGRPLIAKAIRDRGLRAYGIGYAGWRAMTSRDKPLRVPADLKGLRMRSQPAPLHRAMWKLLGATPVESSLNEVASIFRLKQADALDVPALYVFATSVAEQMKFHVRTNHTMQTALIVFHDETFSKLPKRAQSAVFALRAAFYPRFSKVLDAMEVDLVAELGKAGIQVIEPTDDERTLWKKAFLPLRARALELGGKAGAELLQALESKRS